MIDWPLYSRLLYEGSSLALRKFFAEHPEIQLSAIGYTFELGNESPTFSLCADTNAHFEQTKEEYKKEWPQFDLNNLQWSSGDYQFCAGLLVEKEELGVAWNFEYAKLHEWVDANGEFDEVYDGLVCICCETLAALVRNGVIPKSNNLIFNIAEYSDDIKVIKERDRTVQLLIERNA
jgi:hypothetical protein